MIRKIVALLSRHSKDLVQQLEDFAQQEVVAQQEVAT